MEAPDACVRHKYIPAIMLNAQGTSVCDPTPGGGTGTPVEDDGTGEERTHIIRIIFLILCLIQNH